MLYIGYFPIAAVQFGKFGDFLQFARLEGGCDLKDLVSECIDEELVVFFLQGLLHSLFLVYHSK